MSHGVLSGGDPVSAAGLAAVPGPPVEATWGIPSQAFAALYLLGWAALVVWPAVLLIRARSTSVAEPATSLTPWEVAVAAGRGSSRRLRDLVLADLYAHGAIDDSGRLTGARPPHDHRPATVGAALQLLEGQAAQGRAPQLTVADFESLPTWESECDGTLLRLQRAGYLVDRQQAAVPGLPRALGSAGAWWVIGLLRLVTSVPGSPKLLLIAALVAGPFLTLLLCLQRPKVNTLTASGAQQLRRLASSYRAYDPRRQGALLAGGPEVAVMSVAVLGVGPLAAHAPGLAVLDPTTPLVAVGGSGGGSYGWYDSGSSFGHDSSSFGDSGHSSCGSSSSCSSSSCSSSSCGGGGCGG